MATVNDKFKGLGKELYSSTPEDLADANKALARSLGRIKNVFNLTSADLATVALNLETLKGLDLIEDTQVPLKSEVDYFKNQLATGSGPGGELLLVDVVGTVAGWVHKDEWTAEGARINELDALGVLDDLKAAPGGASNPGNGIYTIMKYHAVNNAYQSISSYDYTTTPPTPIYSWSIPAGRANTAGTFGSRNAALKHLINAANTKIGDIARAYPLHAAQSVESVTKMANQLIRERRNQVAAGINYATVPKNQKLPVYSMISNLHTTGTDVSLGGSAWVMEQVADQTNRGGQGVIAAMREGRNIERLNAVGIPTGKLYRTHTLTTTSQAPLLGSTYTVDEAKNSVQE